MSQAKPTPKQLNLKSLAMQAGLKFSGYPTPPKTNFSIMSGIFICWIFLCTLLSAQEVELFVDWNWQAKGQENFSLPEGAKWESLSMLSRIRKRLQEKGWEIRSWELEKHRPYLLTWKEVGGWQDLQHWLRRRGAFLQQNFWVFWSLGPKVRFLNFAKADRDKLTLFIWEPKTVQPEVHDPQVQAHFGKIFTWDDDLVDNRRYFKFHYPVLREPLAEAVPFEEKKFCTMIASRLSSKEEKELYSEREAVIRFFEEKPGEFDLYGRFWEKRRYKNWRGAISDKLGVLRKYKFCICYENTRDVKGYITEKIFDCFAAGVVPVYWGASNVQEYIPSACFIDRRQFQNTQELYDFLKGMSQEEYETYLRSIEAFLKSPEAKLFSVDHFVETFVEGVLTQNPSL